MEQTQEMVGIFEDELDPGKAVEEMTPHEKKIVALRLRSAGWSYAAIAKELGYSNPSGAYNIIKRAMDQQVREGIEVARAMDLERLDMLLNSIWGEAINGNLQAIDTVLRIMDRRARLLGLDAPQAFDTQIEVVYTHDWREVKS